MPIHHGDPLTASGDPAERPKRAMKADFPHTRTITTRWMDNDVYGHVNNVVYYSFFDTAVNGMLVEAGFLDPATSRVIGLVVETSCRYATPLSFPDKVTAGVRVARLGTSSVRYEIGLFRAEDQVAAAEGHFIHVYVDRATRRPAPIAESLRAFLSTLVSAPG